MKESLEETKKTFEFCDNKNKSFNEKILCKQDDFHKSIEGNSIGFVIIYAFCVLFIAFLFQLSKKKTNNDKKK
ncbi:MAG: hypothetical protein VX976_03675 [Pseudomonadota bacterium]|nr:hypothetical protein [Pseudomonadota bacterium]